MNSHRLKQTVLAVVLSLVAAIAAARSGLVLEAAASGLFWSPTLRSVRVAGVEADSRAQRAGFLKGDEILRINDIVVVGHKAREMKRYWDSLSAGEVAIFLVRRQGHEIQLKMAMGE